MTWGIPFVLDTFTHSELGQASLHFSGLLVSSQFLAPCPGFGAIDEIQLDANVWESKSGSVVVVDRESYEECCEFRETVSSKLSSRQTRSAVWLR